MNAAAIMESSNGSAWKKSCNSCYGMTIQAFILGKCESLLQIIPFIIPTTAVQQ